MTADRLAQALRDIDTVLRVEGMDLELGSRRLLKEVQGAIREASETIAAAQSPAEGDAPRVPDYVLACVHAYGDARADDDGTSAQHLRHAIEEMRRWAATLAAPNVQPKGMPEGALWQWRRKGDPWTLEKTFNTPVIATTDDSEVRTLYAAPVQAPAPGESPAELVCAQAYQVVGSLLSDLGQFETDRAEKILDNLNQARVVHDDVLPWPSFASPAVGADEPATREVCGRSYVEVRTEAVDWLKKHYPALCEKSGLCERIGGRLYTRSVTPAPKPPMAKGLRFYREPELTRCAAGSDGDCVHSQCPQLRDGEPSKTGRHCPLDSDVPVHHMGEQP